MNFEMPTIPELGADQDVIVKNEGEFLFSLKNLINIFIDFLNKLIKAEF